MQLASSTSPRLQTSHAIVTRARGLSCITGPTLNVCVWQRRLPVRLATWLAALAGSEDLDLAATLTPGPAASLPLLGALPDGEARRALAADVTRLAGLHAGLLGVPRLRASLATVATDKCRKFHADYKTVRLLCTYAGPGTEWVDDADVDRTALGQEDACIEAANTRIVPRASRIRRAASGDVVLLKGEAYPGNEGRGAVHRSPPIERSGERRLVLTLDAG